MYFIQQFFSVKQSAITRCLPLLLFLSLNSCTQMSLFIVNGLAGFDDYAVVKDIQYGTSELNHLDIYIPADSDQQSSLNIPVIVFFYGGCWGGCYTGLKEDYLFVAQALTSRGYIAVLADYRRYPQVRFPSIIDDARQATEWVKQNIVNYAGDANSIFLMGHSAGAHLAALLTLDESYLSLQTRQAIRGFIGLAGPYDFLPLTEPYQYALFAPQESYPKSQPINFVEGTEPPLLLLYGKDDETVKPRNIINLAAKVQQLGGSVTTQFYDDIDHIDILAALSIPLRSRKSVLDDINQFIALQHVKNSHEDSQRNQDAVRE
jgi:acetyl esterase/lipase